MSATDRCRARAGFTLIELVTVLAVLAILAAAVGGPVLGYVTTIRSRFAAARIAADITYLQRRSMNARLRTWAVFDVANNRYTLYEEDAANPGKANRVAVTHPVTQSSASVQLGSGEFGGASMTAASFNGSNELEFDSFGRPYDTSSAALTSDGAITLNNGVSLTVRRVSGLVEQTG